MATKATKKPAAPEQDTAPVVGAEVQAPIASSKKSDSYDVVNGDRYIRTYSREVHGDNFKDLAEEFVGKKVSKGGKHKLVPSSEIGAVEVRYREKEDADLPADKQKADSVFVDKAKQFTDKDAALKLALEKFGSSIVVVKSKAAKK